MANNQNQQELNKLREEGKIDPKTFAEQDKENVRQVEEGKTTTESLEQFINSNRVVEAAMENTMYLNMLEPCLAEGINITDRLIKYFEDNKVKPSELSVVLQEEMTRIRIGINKDTKNLFFDESGAINIDKSIEKAQRYGVKVANYISNISNDDKVAENPESVFEQEGTPHLINGVDVYKELMSKDEKFYIDFEDKMSKEVEKLTNNPEVKNWFGSSTKPDSKINKDIERKIYNIRDFLLRKPSQMSETEKVTYMLEAFYLFKELKAIDMDQLEGMDPKAIAGLKGFKESVVDLYKFLGIDLGSVDFEKVEEEELIASLTLNGKIKIDKDVIKKDVIAVMNTPREDVISIEDATRDAEEDLRRQEIIRKAKLYKSLSILKYDVNDNYAFNRNAIEKHENRVLQYVEREVPNFNEELEKEFEQDNLLPIYTDVIRRELEKNRMLKFKKADDVTNLADIQQEFSVVMGAFNILSHRDDYADMGYPFEADVEQKRNAFRVIGEVFPDVILEGKTTNDGLNKAIDSKKLFEEILKRYNSVHVVQQMVETNDLFTYAEILAAIRMKNQIEGLLLRPETEQSKEIERILNDKSILEEVRQKRIIDEKSVIHEKGLAILTSEIYDLTARRNNGDFSYENEKKLVEDLVIVAQYYHNVKSSEEHAMYRMVKAELATYLPDAYDGRGYLLHEKIDEEYLKYLLKNGEHIVEGQSPSNEAKERLDKEIEKEYFEGKVVRDPKALAKKLNTESMENLAKMNKFNNQEKILKLLATVKNIRKNNPNAIDNPNIDQYMEQMEFITQKRIRELLPDTEEGREKGDKLIEDINNFGFLEDTSIFTIKELRISSINNDKNAFVKKYAKETQITDKEDIKRILSMYLGTKNDIKENVVDRKTYYAKQLGLKSLLKKISPDLLQGDKVNEEKLLEIYNQNFGTALTDIKDAYAAEEDRLITSIMEDMTGEVLAIDEKYKFSPYLNIVKDDSYLVKNILNQKKFNEMFNTARDTVSIVGGMYNIYDRKNKGQFTKEDETELIKLSVATLGIVSGQKDANEMFDLTEAEIKHDKLNKTAFKMASENLVRFFPEIKREDGTIDMNALEQKYSEYLSENGISIQSSKDLIALTTENTKKEYMPFGPELGISYVDALDRMVFQIDGMFREYENLRITDDEVVPVFAERAEVLDVGEVSEERKKPEEVVKHVEDITDSKKVSQEEEMVSPKIAVEEMNVGEESAPVVDNHPVKVEEKGFFKNAFKSISKLIKEKLTEIKNNIFGENNDSSSGDTSSNATSTTTSSSGTEKKSQIGQENNMFGPQVDLDLKAANENVGKVTESGKGENTIDEK